MLGQKLWFGRKDLLKFGQLYCYLSKSKSIECYENCIKALKDSKNELKKYLEISENYDFINIGTKMLDTWSLPLSEEKHEELSDEIIRSWAKIKELRKNKKITQIELSKIAGISRITLGKLERGEITACRR
jgi:serine/threonine-protein kinase HipA